MTNRRFVLIGLTLALSGCGGDTRGAPMDGSAPDIDGGSVVGVDSQVPPGTDAQVPPGTDGGTMPASGWRAIALPDDMADSRVTGVLCTSRDACAITTQPATGDGQVLAASDHSVGPVLVNGADVEGPANVIGSVGFLGLDRTRDGVVARIDSTGAYVSATGDISSPSSWSVVSIGTTSDGFGINPQEALQVAADGSWLFINEQGYVYGATSAPSATTFWTKLWSPTALPPVPADFPDRYAADPTLCNSDVSTAVAPSATQEVYISQDLGLAIHPAGGINQTGDAMPGVCISTDHGRTFYNVPFTGLSTDPIDPGPRAVTCLDNDRCFAYNGLDFQANTFYVYYTTNASQGVSSTWTRATVPAALTTVDQLDPLSIFFAPDGTHGWMVGSNDNEVMLLRTTDAGHNWTDVTDSIHGLTSARLHAGFALDADHIWVAGEHGTLLFTDSAQH